MAFNGILQNILLFINIFFLYKSKNIVLPFNKISIEDYNGRKTIDDYINYYIYTNISMGTPIQIVSHFIFQDEYYFNFKKRQLSYNYIKSSIFLNKENLSSFWFDNNKSSTSIINDDEEVFSDVYYFDTLNNSIIKVENLRHNTNLKESKELYKCGLIGLYHKNYKIYRNNSINLMEELKSKGIINEYSFTILYNEKRNLFNDQEDNLGKCIIGESPYIFSSSQFKIEDEVANPEKGWSILINQIISSKMNYTEENIEMEIRLTTAFILGTNLYKDEIHKKFFSELIKKNLCSLELLSENIFPHEYYVYSCENNEEMREKIKLFPSLKFEIKINDLYFIFSYADLFKLFNDKLYFMIIFKIEKYSTYIPRWVVGEIFLRKYLTTFNYDSKMIIFYRNQVNEANIKSENVNESKESKKDKSLSINIRTIIEILMGIILIIIFYLLVKICRNSKKNFAKELKDKDYEYIPQENKEYNTLNKEFGMENNNAIINFDSN